MKTKSVSGVLFIFSACIMFVCGILNVLDKDYAQASMNLGLSLCWFGLGKLYINTPKESTKKTKKTKK